MVTYYVCLTNKCHQVSTSEAAMQMKMLLEPQKETEDVGFPKFSGSWRQNFIIYQLRKVKVEVTHSFTFFTILEGYLVKDLEGLRVHQKKVFSFVRRYPEFLAWSFSTPLQTLELNRTLPWKVQNNDGGTSNSLTMGPCYFGQIGRGLRWRKSWRIWMTWMYPWRRKVPVISSRHLKHLKHLKGGSCSHRRRGIWDLGLVWGSWLEKWCVTRWRLFSCIVDDLCKFVSNLGKAKILSPRACEGDADRTTSKAAS